MNLADAQSVVQLEKQAAETVAAVIVVVVVQTDKCMTQYVHPVTNLPRFLSSQVVTDLFIAETVTAAKEAVIKTTIKRAFWLFFLILDYIKIIDQEDHCRFY